MKYDRMAGLRKTANLSRDIWHTLTRSPKVSFFKELQPLSRSLDTVYEEVNDCSQPALSMRWVVSKKNEKLRNRYRRQKATCGSLKKREQEYQCTNNDVAVVTSSCAAACMHHRE